MEKINTNGFGQHFEVVELVKGKGIVAIKPLTSSFLKHIEYLVVCQMQYHTQTYQNQRALK